MLRKRKDYVGAIIVIQEYLLDYPNRTAKDLYDETCREGIYVEYADVRKILYDLRVKYGRIKHNKANKTYSLTPGTYRWFVDGGGLQWYRRKHGRQNNKISGKWKLKKWSFSKVCYTPL